MKKVFLKIFILLFFLLLESCSHAGISDVQLDHINSSITPSTLQTSTATATAFPTSLLPTATPESISTMMPDTKIIRNCPTILSSMPDNNYPGIIILKECLEPGADASYFFLELATMKKTTLSSNLIKLVVSPDGKHFAYSDYTEHLLKLYSVNNQLLASYDMREDWKWLGRWQNNQNLIIYEERKNKVTPSLSGPMVAEYPATLILFNPFNDQERLLAPEYPEIDRASPYIDWDKSGTTVYNKQLTQVVYPGTAVSGMGFILWDIPESSIVVKMDDPAFRDPPKWAEDGSEFIILGLEDELFIVTNLGEISQITKLNHGDFRYHPERYTWSPDGRYIAMWLNDTKTSSGSFVILDTQSKEIIDYCICIEQYLGGFIDTVTPIWAQNSKALIVEANLDEDSDEKTALILDLENNLAIRLVEGAVPIGWLDNQN